MGLIIKTLFVITLVISAASKTNAAWQGPAEMISGAWGNDVKQFGIEHGDSGDDFPLIEAITPDNKIVITDMVNKKQIVYGLDSSFVKEVKWVVKSQTGGRTYYDIAEYSFGPVVGYSDDGNIYTGSGNKYFLKSPTGQLIKTSATRPLELGSVSEQYIAPGQYKVTVKYPDKEWGLVGEGALPKYIRDTKGNLIGYGEVQAIRYTSCGKELAVLTMPEKNVKEISRGPAVEPKVKVLEEYGSPVIAPNGDVYTWKRTPDKYSILKWTWKDDPNVPTGPDAPTGLSVAASINGLYLTWTASPQDPGCVTGYEVARATSAGGVYSTIATTEKGVVKYNDTTAEAGTTYYYKVRAKAGSEYSNYTAEVSGKR